MSTLTHARIEEYARKMKVKLHKQSASQGNLDALAKYIDKTNMCGGYILTNGADRIQKRDGYSLNDTNLYIAHREDNNEIIGFVMFAKKFIKSHHANVNIDHPNFEDKTSQISVILDICAAPPASADSSVRGIKGVGTLLMLLALSHCGKDGAVLFVSQVPKKLKVSMGKKKKKTVYDIWYSTPSGLAFYEKMDFEVVKGYDRSGDLMGGAQIRYRDNIPTLQEANAFMRKYTGSATRPSKKPHRIAEKSKSPSRHRSRSSSPRSSSKPAFTRFNVVDSPASSVSSGRVRSPSSPGGVQVRKKKSVSSRKSSPGAVLEYLREMKAAKVSSSRKRSSSRKSSGRKSERASIARSSGRKSSGRKSERASIARSSGRRSSGRKSSDRRSSGRRSSGRKSSDRRSSGRKNSENRNPNSKKRKPTTGVYCGDKERGPNGRRRGTPRQCFSKGVGVGFNLGRHGGSPVRQF
jgi:hypothetical protein